jgi:hypothetical protein
MCEQAIFACKTKQTANNRQTTPRGAKQCHSSCKTGFLGNTYRHLLQQVKAGRHEILEFIIHYLIKKKWQQSKRGS